MTPEQIRGARAMLGWRQEELAERAGLGVTSIRQIEAGKQQPHRATVVVLRMAFEAAGIELIPGGVKIGRDFHPPTARPRQS